MSAKATLTIELNKHLLRNLIIKLIHGIYTINGFKLP